MRKLMTSLRALSRFSFATGLRARWTATSVISLPLTVAAGFGRGGAWANRGAAKTKAARQAKRIMRRTSDGSKQGRPSRRESQGRVYSEGGPMGKGQSNRHSPVEDALLPFRGALVP